MKAKMTQKREKRNQREKVCKHGKKKKKKTDEGTNDISLKAIFTSIL